MENLKLLLDINFANGWWVLLLPTALMAIDFITGVLNAWIKNDLKSFKMRQGLGKKCGEIVALILGELLTIGLTLPRYIITGISIYIVFMEMISIFENLQKLGVPIPKFIQKAIGVAEDILDDGELSDEAKKTLKELTNEKRKED